MPPNQRRLISASVETALDSLSPEFGLGAAEAGAAASIAEIVRMGPPPSLLNQTVVTVEGNGQTVEIPMRMIFACTNLGLIPGFSASMDIPRHLRVSSLGRWVRLDAPFGSIYRSTRLSLF